MIILITGATHAGKTRLAQKMMEKYKYPYYSLDHIKMGLIRSGCTTLTPSDNRELTDYLWPIVSEIVKTAIENHQNLIIEGCYVPFDWKKSFEDSYLREIRYICLCMSLEYIDEHFDLIKRFNSCIECRGDDADCTIEVLKEENSYYLEGCKNNNLECVLITSNYTETIDQLFV